MTRRELFAGLIGFNAALGCALLIGAGDCVPAAGLGACLLALAFSVGLVFAAPGSPLK